jgi:hypothetical protein
MFKLSFFILILTIPFFSSELYYGVPFWVYISLGATLLYATVLIYVIEKKWKSLKDG